jgi:hypothetical protein
MIVLMLWLSVLARKVMSAVAVRGDTEHSSGYLNDPPSFMACRLSRFRPQKGQLICIVLDLLRHADAR